MGRHWGPLSFLSSRYCGLFPRWINRPEREADHSSPPSAEFNNACSSTTTPTYIFMAWYLVKHWDIFAFCLYLPNGGHKIKPHIMEAYRGRSVSKRSLIINFSRGRFHFRRNIMMSQLHYLSIIKSKSMEECPIRKLRTVQFYSDQRINLISKRSFHPVHRLNPCHSTTITLLQWIHGHV
jgi:hypothetical protein